MTSTMQAGKNGMGPGRVDARLRRLISDAMAESGEIVSVVVGDDRGLPITGLVRGSIPVMTLTAIAAMSARSAEEAAVEVDLGRPIRVLVETRRGDLVMIPVEGESAYLIALVSARAERNPPLDVLDRLAKDVAGVLATI